MIRQSLRMWAALVAVAANGFAAEVPRVIFDTDMYTDYDDVGALAILHTLADAGECEIIAVGSNTWGEGNKAVAVCEIINAYYGRPDIPVGCARSGGRQGPGDAGYGLPEKYPHLVRHAVSTNAPPAVDVYRAALAAAPDKSVVLCSVGFLNNVADLLRADRALVARKVARWVCMACDYPKGKEYNSKHDPAASAYAFTNWPTNVPITFVDFPIGRHCYAGRAVAELPDTANPIRDAFRNRLTPRHKVVPGESWDQMAGHPSWDEIAALVAVRGLEPYFGLQRGFHRMVGTDGENVWTDDPQSPHGRVTFKATPEAVGRALDELMCRLPMARTGCGLSPGCGRDADVPREEAREDGGRGEAALRREAVHVRGGRPQLLLHAADARLDDGLQHRSAVDLPEAQVEKPPRHADVVRDVRDAQRAGGVRLDEVHRLREDARGGRDDARRLAQDDALDGFRRDDLPSVSVPDQPRQFARREKADQLVVGQDA